MLQVMNFMGPVITYVEVTLFKYHMFLFITIYPMSISDMEHYALSDKIYFVFHFMVVGSNFLQSQPLIVLFREGRCPGIF